MARKAKLGSPRGVSEWRNLDTLGDVRRLIAWTIHSFREKRLDAREANTFGQLANILLATIKDSDLEQRIVALERSAAAIAANEEKKTWERTKGVPNR
jgi:hypothetical protein